MIIGIIRALRELAVLKHRMLGQEIKPLREKTWTECYTHLEDVDGMNWHKLDYEVVGQDSAAAIVIEY